MHQSVVEALTDYLIHHNANHRGAFATSERSDVILDEVHAAMADMLDAAPPDEIAHT